MLEKEEIQVAVNNILEMIYALYQKELKAGKLNKDNLVSSFGKVIKKKAVKNNDLPNLFNY